MEKSGHNSCNESLIVVFSYGLHLFITADCLIANDCVLHYIYIYANSGFSGLLSLLNMFRFVGWEGPIRLGYKSTHVCNVCNVCIYENPSVCFVVASGSHVFRFYSTFFAVAAIYPCWLMISSGIAGLAETQLRVQDF
jgi:hypothetical protein